MGKIKCYTANLNDAKRCVMQLQNAAASSNFVIVSKPNNATMLFDTNQLSTWATEVFTDGKHLFGGNQANSYTVSVASYPIANKIGVEFNINYMADPKAVNDLRCTCAVIAKSLMNQLKSPFSFLEKISEVQRFFTRQFKYRDSGQSEDHSAVDLMRSGAGVCQAIATMATIILPFMGVPCLYVSGEGFSGIQWGPHGWNVVKNPEGKWIFVDFTFGLNSGFFPPSTINKLTSRHFLRNHRWDTERHAVEALDTSLVYTTKIHSTQFFIRPNKHMFAMDGIAVSPGKQMLQKNERGYCIDLVFLFRLAGGGVEYILDSDRLHFVLYDKQVYIERASMFINKNGTFDIRILNSLPVLYTFEDDGIVLRLGGKDE